MRGAVRGKRIFFALLDEGRDGIGREQRKEERTDKW